MTLPFDINDPATYPPVGSPMWHLHHEGLMEWLTEPLVDRVNYVEKYKAETEIETRLRWMTPVLGTLPASVVKARAAYDEARAVYTKALAAHDTARAAYDTLWATSAEAWAAYNTLWATSAKAWAAYNMAWAAYNKAWNAAKPAIKALHTIEHLGCPWDGRTIFPEGTP